MTDAALIARMSNERLEQNIAALYYEYHTGGNSYPVWSEGLLGLYWHEFDKRVDQGTIKDVK